jgi:hypothetical protein
MWEQGSGNGRGSFVRGGALPGKLLRSRMSSIQPAQITSIYRYPVKGLSSQLNLAQLPFSIIEKMLRVKRMDMIIHVSLQDLQRNLDKHSRVGGTLDIFAPGWREAVDVNQSTAAL